MRDKLTEKFSNCFLFLMVTFLMLSGQFDVKAQNSGTVCSTIQVFVADPDIIDPYSPGGKRPSSSGRYVPQQVCVTKPVNDGATNSTGRNSTQNNTNSSNNQTTGFDPSTFGASMSEEEAIAAAKDAERRKEEAERLFVGGWKHSEVYPNTNYLKKEVIFNISKNSSVEMNINGYVPVDSKKLQWIYKAETSKLGIMELYLQEESKRKLIEKASIKWIDKNKFEYTVTFHDHVTTFGWKSSNFEGEKFVFTKQ